ncbi:hypothetical protein [Candidatus Burkholderia verschuerenii]|uniref:hypothetical protein n=1 Tax=Candidatus Burkholderia verschuerenii TaxID=242163 RepID=UPI0018DDDF7E|nr:hypothetical protein [Candidatus Burkholderia verschuerenii]
MKMIFGSAFIGPGREEPAGDADGCLGADMGGVMFRGEAKMMTDDYDGSSGARERRRRGAGRAAGDMR